MKNEIKETAKQTSPKVSSLGYGRKWVNCNVKVFGWIHEFPTIYSHPASPKINKVKESALRNFIAQNILYNISVI